MTKKTEQIIQTNKNAVKLLFEKSLRKEYLDAMAEIICRLSTCRCVGVRVLNEDKKIPYEASIGFNEEFLESENRLSIENDQCVCIRIITGIPDPQDKKVMTPDGSFHCINTIKFINGLSSQEKSRFKGLCFNNGFKSVSIIPIPYNDQVIGLIHLADEKKKKISLDTVKFIESLAFLIGEGINKFNLTDKIQKQQKELNDSKQLSDIGTLSAIVAHELRNPLSSIQIAAYNISKKSKDPLIKSHLLNIEKKIYESNETIDNLLFYSHIKNPNYENMNVFDILNECIDITKKQFHTRKIRIYRKYKTLKNIFIYADIVQIKELFNNILSNAYDSVLDTDGRIVIRGVCDEKSVKVYVEDNGKGIGREDIDKIYEPFFTTKNKGTGLGLCVCNQIVKLHNGDINIESELGKGTIVNVKLPINR